MFFEYDYASLSTDVNSLFELEFPNDIYKGKHYNSKYSYLGFPEHIDSPIEHNLSECVNAIHVDKDKKCFYIKIFAETYDFMHSPHVKTIPDLKSPETKLKIFQKHEDDFRLIELNRSGKAVKIFKFTHPEISLYEELYDSLKYDIWKVSYEKREELLPPFSKNSI